METGSYLLVGQPAGAETFYSTCHGSGRVMSRSEAKRRFRGEKIIHDMREHGIYVRAVSMPGVAEEAGGAYKDIDEVVLATEIAGLTRRVARFEPIGNVKG
jgi:tRNA-splicing ligase RtcB